MLFNSTLPEFDESCFTQQDWRCTPCSKAREAIPTNAPITRGLGVKVNANVDSDHAGDNVTRISRTCYVIFLNSSPVYFHTKKQGRIETITFASEFITMKQCCEYTRGLRYKIRMMGIGVDGTAHIFGDNKSVLVNSSIPTSVLKKKSNSIAFNFVREGCAANEWRVAYVNTHDNVADLLTKPLTNGAKRRTLIDMIFHFVY